MVFKRRDTRPLPRLLTEFIYPKGGWKRATSYVIHRLRRLPDGPHRIARGVFAGVFISFTPLFGFHFLGAALIAWIMRGNIIAALLATFVGNPLTTPFFAASALETGYWLLGSDYTIPLSAIAGAFTDAATQMWSNIFAIFTDDLTHWDSLRRFFRTVYVPYLVGGVFPGTVVGLFFYFISIPLVRAYQKIRDAKRAERARKRQAARMRALAEAEAADWTELRDDSPGETEGDDSPRQS